MSSRRRSKRGAGEGGEKKTGAEEGRAEGGSRERKAKDEQME